MSQWLKNNDVLGTTNRGTPCESGLCTLCRADCQGRCETWLGSMLGRDTLYPRDFGVVTAGSGNTAPDGVCYNALRINGYLYGAGARTSTKPSPGIHCLPTSVWKPRSARAARSPAAILL